MHNFFAQFHDLSLCTLQPKKKEAKFSHKYENNLQTRKILVEGKAAMLKKRTLSPVKIILAVILVAVALFPILWMLLLAIRPSSEMSSGNVSFLPAVYTLENFRALFSEYNFLRALKNSVIVTASSLAISLCFGIPASYIIARNRFSFPGKTVITYWVLIVRILPPIAFAVPLYIMFSSIGILKTLLPEVAACVLINLPLIIWFLSSFFQDVPIELEESAKIDGASEWSAFCRIVLPLVLPGIAAVSMLSFVYAWNEYTYGVIFVQNASNYTTPLMMAILNTEDNIAKYGVVAAGGLVSILPMAIFVIFAQKSLISGLSSGAVKG